MTLPRRTRDAGAGDAATPVLQYWVGAVEDSDIRLGVAEEGERARLFFCGGPSSYATKTRWAVVDLAADGGFELDEPDWQIAGKLGDDELEGKVRIGSDAARSFAARPISDDTIAGLYEGTADCGRVGLIVVQAKRGDEPTGQGACVNMMGRPPEQVNPILPIALRDDEIRVEVGGQETGVHPAAGPPKR